MTNLTEKNLSEIASDAKAAALILSRLDTETKNRVLQGMATQIETHCDEILEANRQDLEFAKKEKISGPLVARLAVDETKILGMAQGIRSVADLPDPVGQKQEAMELDDGLELTRVSCPIGVIGAIFESRPDAVPQISALCFKSGNAVILKGGAEAQNSNRVIVGLIQKALSEVEGVPLIPRTARNISASGRDAWHRGKTDDEAPAQTFGVRLEGQRSPMTLYQVRSHRESEPQVNVVGLRRKERLERPRGDLGW